MDFLFFLTSRRQDFRSASSDVAVFLQLFFFIFLSSLPPFTVTNLRGRFFPQQRSVWWSDFWHVTHQQSATLHFLPECHLSACSCCSQQQKQRCCRVRSSCQRRIFDILQCCAAPRGNLATFILFYINRRRRRGLQTPSIFRPPIHPF